MIIIVLAEFSIRKNTHVYTYMYNITHQIIHYQKSIERQKKIRKLYVNKIFDCYCKVIHDLYVLLIWIWCERVVQYTKHIVYIVEYYADCSVRVNSCKCDTFRQMSGKRVGRWRGGNKVFLRYVFRTSTYTTCVIILSSRTTVRWRRRRRRRRRIAKFPVDPAGVHDERRANRVRFFTRPQASLSSPR